MDNAILQEVIISTIGRRGSGQSFQSPIRCITQVFSKDGNELANLDPYSFPIEQIENAINEVFVATNLAEISNDLKMAILQKLSPQ